MILRKFIKTAGLIIGFTIFTQQLSSKDSQLLAKKQEKRPNILIITTDQQSYNMMSCMGNSWLQTPNMDRIAKAGYRFDRTYCVNPVCMPSRFSLYTGHYSTEAGIKENTTAFDEKKVSDIVKKDAMGNLFSKAGYKTLYSGKTHLYGTKDLKEYGFVLDGLDPYNGPAVYAEKTLSELGKEKNGGPFLMVLSFLNPHDICQKAGADKKFPDGLPADKVQATKTLLALQKTLAPEQYKNQIPPSHKNLEPINGEVPEMVDLCSKWRNWDDTQWNLYNWMYHRLTESVDAQIGRALDALRKSGLEDNTIIIFTSDHGEMNRSHGLILKNVAFEECQRVPFIFAGKGIKQNYIDSLNLICNGIDLLPTVCELAGIKPPKGLPGISLKPLITGEVLKSKRNYIITETYNSFTINDGRFKYTIYELPGNPELLTDIKVNPGETINYSGDAAFSKIKAKLKKDLFENLAKRKLLPLKENRSIANLRKMENEYRQKTNKKQKTFSDED